MSRTAELDHYDNPYQASAYDTLEPSQELQTEINLDELHAFVGKRFNYYLKKWTARLQDPTADVGIHWWALLFPGFCLAYRKMYRNYFVYSGVVIALSIGQAVFFMGALKLPNVPTGVSLIFQLMVGLVCALCINGWYLTHALNKIAEAKAHGRFGQQLYQDLMQRGGTSFLGAIGLSIAVSFGMGIILAFGIIMAVVIAH